jgi:exonuclease VII large subunit
MNMVARHVWHNGLFRWFCAGWDGGDAESVEPPPPTFDKKHFYEIVFPKKKDRDTEQEHAKYPTKREEWNAQWMQECEAKYEAWCERVLKDLEENAEFNSEAQMDKFKSRMLRGMETTVESSGKSATQEQVKALSDAVQSHATQEQVKATQEQVKALSDAVQQMHASMQLILQKLNP